MPSITGIASPGTSIPVYSLAQYSRTGNALMEIAESDGQNLSQNQEFLIPHRKDYYLFVLVRQGNSRHWIDGICYTLQPDTFYFTIPPQVHLKEEAQPLIGLALAFSESFLDPEENRSLKELPILCNPAGGHELRLQPEEVSYIEEIMRKMLVEFSADSGWKNQMLASLLRVLVIYCSRLYTRQFGESAASDSRSVLKEFQQLVNHHHASLHDVASYAGLLSMTPGHLGDLIKLHSGKTALSHIHERLTVEAKRKLLHTDLSVKEISDQLGFQDPAYFTRFFKRMTADTPVGYRERTRQEYSW